MSPVWTFGDRLIRIRKTMGLSQSQMAELIEVAPKSISRWENGDWAANVAGGMMMMQAFGLSFDGAKPGEVTVEDFVEGESGVVVVELLDEDGKPWSDDPGDGSAWVFEDGWRIDDCEEFDLETEG